MTRPYGFSSIEEFATTADQLAVVRVDSISRGKGSHAVDVLTELRMLNVTVTDPIKALRMGERR